MIPASDQTSNFDKDDLFIASSPSSPPHLTNTSGVLSLNPPRTSLSSSSSSNSTNISSLSTIQSVDSNGSALSNTCLPGDDGVPEVVASATTTMQGFFFLTVSFVSFFLNSDFVKFMLCFLYFPIRGEKNGRINQS